MEFKVFRKQPEIRIDLLIQHIRESPCFKFLGVHMRTRLNILKYVESTTDCAVHGHVTAISTNVLYLWSDAKRRMSDEHRDMLHVPVEKYE